MKISIDGENSLIYVLPGVNDIDVKTELYMVWSEWYNSANNARFEVALIGVGGEPINELQAMSEAYFFTNGWKLVCNTGEAVNIGVNLFTFNPDGVVVESSNDSIVTLDTGKAVIVSQDELLELVQSIKGKIDLLSFVGSKVISTLDGEQVTLTPESANDARAKVTIPL